MQNSSLKRVGAFLGSQVLLIVLGLVFLFAGAAKAYDPLSFASALKYSFHISQQVSVLLAAAVPVLEMFVALGLITGYPIKVALWVGRILIIGFILLHLWSIVILQSGGSCHCFGGFVELGSKATLTIVLFMALIAFARSSTSSIPVRDRAFGSTKPGRMRKFALVTGVVCLVAAAVAVRYRSIDSDFDLGVIDGSSNSEVRERLETIVQTLDINKDDSKPLLLLLLRSPGCGTCVEELLFWNALDLVQRVNIVGLFPGAPEEHLETDVETEKKIEEMSKALGFKYPVSKLDRTVFREIVGKGRGFAVRIVLSLEGRYLYANRGGDNEMDRMAFARTIDSLLIAQKHFSEQVSQGSH